MSLVFGEIAILVVLVRCWRLFSAAPGILALIFVPLVMASIGMLNVAWNIFRANERK